MHLRTTALIGLLLAACLTFSSPVLSAERSRDLQSLVELDQVIENLEKSIADLQSLLASLKENRQLIAGQLRVAEPKTIISVLFAPANLREYGNKIGETFTFCVKGASSGNIWGTGLYTHDSSLAAAAVHAGALRAGEWGVVDVTVLPGQSSYKGSSANGVTSGSYGSHSASYQVSRNTSKGIYVLPDPDWMTQFRDRRGEVLYFRVTGTSRGSVWGTEVYTDDSELAAAAVHAGFLKDGETGIIGVMFLPGQDKYVGSTRNGVRSSDFWQYGGSYRIVERYDTGD
jgi:hypothetical protein